MPGFGVEPQHVAVAELAIGAAVDGFGRHVDRRRHLARRAGHAAVGDQRHLEAAVLQHAERRRQIVQLRHADGLGPGEADHGDEVAIELARLERRLQPLLACGTPAPAPR